MGRRLALLGPAGQCAPAQRPLVGNVPGKCGHGELFLFLVKKEPVVGSNDASSYPFVSAERLKACALIGLHHLAAEGESGSGGSQSTDLGDIIRQCCPVSAEWISSCSAKRDLLGL